ncbi:MAG: BON domain-containing protein [Planctomycetota bacterium]|nr:BON domain-containing protein [Planctomycetota bacterium]
MEKLSQAITSDDVVIHSPSIDFKALSARIRRAVRRQTSGGVQNLIVEVDHQSVRLDGTCLNFYCKQLAQQAVMRIHSTVPVINRIEVAGG